MRIIRVLLLVLVLFCVAIFGALIHSRARGKHFTSIHPGQTVAEVQQHAGKPSRTMTCSALPEPPDSCKTVLVYAGPFASVMPEFWLIPLDGNERVMRVLHTTRAD